MVGGGRWAVGSTTRAYFLTSKFTRGNLWHCLFLSFAELPIGTFNLYHLYHTLAVLPIFTTLLRYYPGVLQVLVRIEKPLQHTPHNVYFYMQFIF